MDYKKKELQNTVDIIDQIEFLDIQLENIKEYAKKVSEISCYNPVIKIEFEDIYDEEELQQQPSHINTTYVYSDKEGNVSHTQTYIEKNNNKGCLDVCSEIEPELALKIIDVIAKHKRKQKRDLKLTLDSELKNLKILSK